MKTKYTLIPGIPYIAPAVPKPMANLRLHRLTETWSFPEAK